MPKKHGVSHGLATFATSILSAVIGKLVSEKISFFRVLWDRIGEGFSNSFYKITDVYIASDIFPIAILAAVFAFGWGAAFALMHND